MTAPPVAIIGAGMMTGVGLTAPSSCAAIRCAIDNFSETRFIARINLLGQLNSAFSGSMPTDGSHPLAETNYQINTLVDRPL